MKKLFILFIAVAGFSIDSFGQTSANGTAIANLVSAITIAKSGDGIINFGSIRQGTAGTVTVPGVASPTRTFTGVTLVGNTAASAAFTVTGTAGAAYTVTLPSSASVSDGTNTIPVSLFSSDIALPGTSAVGTTPTSVLAASTRTFYVGATLTIAGTEPVGIYNSGATFAVTVAYN